MRICFIFFYFKDFFDEVLQLIYERDNICKQIYLLVQSGSSCVLEVMWRGYLREVYVELVYYIREFILGVSFSSDFIVGFCGEMEEDYVQIVFLFWEVQYNMGFFFVYSMRQKIWVYYRLKDDVLEEVKLRCLEEFIIIF